MELVDAVIAYAESGEGKQLAKLNQEGKLAKRNASVSETLNRQLADLAKRIGNLERIAAAEREALIKYYGVPSIDASSRGSSSHFDKLS